MNGLIEIKLNVTPEQLGDIALVMSGAYQRPLVGIDGCGACGDGCVDRKEVCRLAEESPDTTAAGEQLPPEIYEQADAAVQQLCEGDTELRTGPFYWHHSESNCVGIEETAEGLDSFIVSDLAVCEISESQYLLLKQEANEASAAAPTGVKLDSAGLPWDVRIHASTKTQKADKTWKIKRGTSPAVIVEVEAELRAALAAVPSSVPAPPTAGPSAALAAAGTTDPKLAGVAADPTAAAPDTVIPAPPAAAQTTAVAAAAAVSPTTFPELLPLVSAAKANGTISDDQIATAVTQIGLTKFGELAVRPDLIPQFAELVGV